MVSCSFCRGPFHIASGEIVGHPRSYPVCGACMKDTYRWLRGHLNRKWSKQSFYANATVPPPAVEKRFLFKLYELKPETRCTYIPFEVEQTGVTFDEARICLTERYPGVLIPSEHMRGCWREL